ncbi:hypothetical protein [Roseateles violae]|uniref:Transmembrane protein n=1 Tax=Roseateles violae TaxID=3058042 RepID=A0ABT8DZ57_9BURK|nr:hypothetical protein [Pelomonas sp. PFR6]MDN3922843.1 hypothetical protein [Pelomonas sp. PFR6]
MYLVAIAWFYVALMMALAEAVSSQGSVLGALITFTLYGLLPIGIVLYVMGAPRRREARRRQEREELLQAQQRAAASAQGDGGDHAAAEPLAPVGKEP